MKAKTIKEVLIAAKYMLIHIGWHQGRLYQDACGFPLPVWKAIEHPEYVGSMCLLGAVHLVHASNELKERAEDVLGNMSSVGIAFFNDNRTKDEVLALLDQAIEEAP